MLLSPVNLFVLQTLLILIVAFSMFAIAKSFRKHQTKNYFVLFIKTFLLALLGALFLFTVSTAFNPKLTLSLMRDYWRLQMVEEQISYQQQHPHKLIKQQEQQVKNLPAAQ
jgi:hypothetical protein